MSQQQLPMSEQKLPRIAQIGPILQRTFPATDLHSLLFFIPKLRPETQQALFGVGDNGTAEHDEFVKKALMPGLHLIKTGGIMSRNLKQAAIQVEKIAGDPACVPSHVCFAMRNIYGNLGLMLEPEVPTSVEIGPILRRIFQAADVGYLLVITAFLPPITKLTLFGVEHDGTAEHDEFVKKALMPGLHLIKNVDIRKMQNVNRAVAEVVKMADEASAGTSQADVRMVKDGLRRRRAAGGD